MKFFKETHNGGNNKNISQKAIQLTEEEEKKWYQKGEEPKKPAKSRKELQQGPYRTPQGSTKAEEKWFEEGEAKSSLRQRR